MLGSFLQLNEAITVQQIKQKCPNPQVHSIAFPLEVPTTKVIHIQTKKFTILIKTFLILGIFRLPTQQS